ncbi:MAG: hypothetical protein KFB93_07295 [Simkaniaceae bacterium]|nr:MAG: hypothetical protein KFB93_07295 [Simkaniaceae bacterium]
MKWLLTLFFFPSLAFTFVLEPWYTTIGEFQFRSAYSYQYYPSVNQGKNPSSYHSHDHLIDLNLGIQFWPNWEFQVESDFSNTRKLNWGTQRFGIQLRYLLLDDVAGDPVSLSLGLQSYYVPSRNLRDVSSPYHAQGNIELGAAIGKEIDKTYNWLFRFWGFLGVGTANRGLPWVRPLLATEMKFQQQHKLKVFSEGYVGFGHLRRININQFNGYAKIAHRSIDLGLNYSYLFKIWGTLGFQYAYRLYAHSFPEHASTFKVEYRLPFSLF